MNTSPDAFRPQDVSVLEGHIINGETVEAGADTVAVLRPSDGQPHGNIHDAGEALVDQAVTAARRAFPRWAARAPRERAALMLRWASLVEQHAAQLAREESVVSSRLIDESAAVDVPAAINWIRFYAEYADKIEGSVTATRDDTLSLVVHEPHGVVAAIAPWNFPLVLATWKIAPALAAGNCVVVKPSEFTPYSVNRIAALAIEAGIPPGVINVVHGLGASTGRALVRHPGVDFITFTGSTATGASIMADAAETGIKPVTLELGGKSPQLVFADQPDLDAVADHVAWGITRNAGQLCYAGTRLVVHESLEQPLLERVATRLGQLQPGPTWQPGATLAPIISRRQLERIKDLVRATVAEGAETTLGGKAFDGPAGGGYFEPTILRGLRTDMTGFTAEIFGPVLGVQTFADPDEGIELAQHPVYGLAGSVFTRDINLALRAARRLQAGTVWVNRWGRKPPDMTSPFGGYRQSGFGKESGRAGFEKFFREKSIWIDLEP